MKRAGWLSSMSEPLSQRECQASCYPVIASLNVCDDPLPQTRLCLAVLGDIHEVAQLVGIFSQVVELIPIVQCRHVLEPIMQDNALKDMLTMPIVLADELIRPIGISVPFA